MEPVNIKTTQEKEKARKQIYYANHKEQAKQYYIDNKAKRCEMINCECGGKFQRQGKADHAKTIMHINFINGITPEVKVKIEHRCSICGSYTNDKRHLTTQFHLMKVKELE